MMADDVEEQACEVLLPLLTPLWTAKSFNRMTRQRGQSQLPFGPESGE